MRLCLDQPPSAWRALARRGQRIAPFVRLTKIRPMLRRLTATLLTWMNFPDRLKANRFTGGLIVVIEL